jgi:hypothetical protein
MEWDLHLFIERRTEAGWQAVCPPLPSSPKTRPKWGRYEPESPVEALAVLGGGPDVVPTKAPRWNFGYHPTAWQQLGAYFSYVHEGEMPSEDIREIEPFLDPCGTPGDKSPQVRDAMTKFYPSDPVNATWYTIRELTSGILTRRSDEFQRADRRIVALRDDMVRLSVTLFPDVCSCRASRFCCHRDEKLRTVLWFEKRKKKGD